MANRERLLIAARIVRAAKPDDFYMGRFGNPCGTPACVLGHYAASPLQDTFYMVFPKDDARSYVALKTDGRPIWYDSDAICSHFDLSPEEARELFDGEGCGDASTPTEAADYIVDFVHRECGE